MTFEQSLSYLNGLGEAHIKPGLQRIRSVLSVLDNPHQQFKSIHIAGTNGKGSTAYYLYRLLRLQLQRAGLYTSPHLVSIHERIRWGAGDEYLISDEEWVECFKEVMLASQKAAVILSYFEYITAMAFLWFSKLSLDYVIVEVGLGGRWDATNVVSATHSVITNIALDHQEYLGETLEQILEEKMGIIKSGQSVLSMVKQNDLREQLERRVQEREANVRFLEAEGDTGQQNLYLAQELAYDLGFSATMPSDLESSWIGRMEWIRPHICLDGAHNPEAMCQLGRRLRGFPEIPIIVLGIMARKDIPGMLKVLLPHVNEVILVDDFDKNQCSVDLLEKECLKYPLKVSKIKGFKLGGLLSQTQDTILVTGSLYLVGWVRRLLI